MSGTSTDARVVRTRALVQDAVRDLFEREGAGALTHQRVAERAGVSRATVYRHWPLPLDLVVEALGVASQPLLHLSAGQPLREWLRGELIRAAEDFGRPVVRQFIAAIVSDAGRSELITELVAELTRRTVSAVREALDRAEAEGTVFKRRDEYQLVAELVGPVIVQVMMYRMPADEHWIARLVDVAVDDRCAPRPGPALSAGRRPARLIRLLRPAHPQRQATRTRQWKTGLRLAVKAATPACGWSAQATMDAASASSRSASVDRSLVSSSFLIRPKVAVGPDATFGRHRPRPRLQCAVCHHRSTT